MSELQSSPRILCGEDKDVGCLRADRGPLIFMHIPKCAGTSLDKSLRDGIDPSRQFALMGPTLYGDFTDFDSFSPGVRGWIHEAWDDCPVDVDYASGHAGSRWFDHLYPDGRKITVLREPKMRILSHWLYWRTFTEIERNYWGSYSPRFDFAMHDLETFVGAPELASQIDNVVTRMLLYPHPLIPGGDFILPENDEALTAEAIATIRHFDFVGVIEDRDLISKLATWLGRPLTLALENVTRPASEALRQPLHQALTERAWGMLETRSRLDQRLWDYVVERTMRTDPRALQSAAVAFSVAHFADLMR